MKAIFFSISVFFASFSLTNAQDTTSVPIKQDDPELRQSSNEIQQHNLKDMVKINVREVPADLKKALQRREYKGDTKTYYKHKERDEYGVEIQTGEVHISICSIKMENRLISKTDGRGNLVNYP